MFKPLKFYCSTFEKVTFFLTNDFVSSRANNSMMRFDHSELYEVYLLFVNIELEYHYSAFIDLRMNL